MSAGEGPVTQEGIDDPGDLLGGFCKAVADPGADHLVCGTGIELRLVAVGPCIQTLDLKGALLQLRKEREKIAPEILRLSEELLN